MNIFEETKKLNLITGEYIVLGSGILGALGIREIQDIDLLVTPKLFDELKQAGWKYDEVEMEGRMRERLTKDNAEAFKDFWYGEYTPDTMRMIREVDMIKNVPFLPLTKLVEIKKIWNRPKDIQDIQLIEKYWEEHKIKKLFQITTDRMFTAIESFHVWKKMSQMMNTQEVGQEQAERNVEIFKKHWDFFHTVQHSTYKSFVTDLSIFFDPEKYEETFSLKKLVNLIKEKISDTEYKNLTKEIESIKRKHGVTIKLLLDLRNSDVSHQAMERKSHLILFKEIEELFGGVQEILNLLGKYNDGSFTVWDHIGKSVTGGLEWVIDNLERGEKVRMEEIMSKYSTPL